MTSDNPLLAQDDDNPLTETAADLDQLLLICEARNLPTTRVNAHRWFYVLIDHEANTTTIAEIDGLQADEVRTMFDDGWKPDYVGWSKERLKAETKLIYSRLQMGMSKTRHEAWLQERRSARAREWPS